LESVESDNLKVKLRRVVKVNKNCNHGQGGKIYLSFDELKWIGAGVGEHLLVRKGLVNGEPSLLITNSEKDGSALSDDVDFETKTIAILVRSGSLPKAYAMGMRYCTACRLMFLMPHYFNHCPVCGRKLRVKPRKRPRNYLAVDPDKYLA